MSDLFRSASVLVSQQLPIPPSPGEEARRIVRHGMADVLGWLGEHPGPRPDEQMHVIASNDCRTFFVSREFYDRLSREVTQ